MIQQWTIHDPYIQGLSIFENRQTKKDNYNNLMDLWYQTLGKDMDT